MTNVRVIKDSFELDWQAEPDGHTAHKINAADGSVEVIQVGNIFNPVGWKSFFRHGFPVTHDANNDVGWAQPEARHSTATDPDRFRTGQRGQLIFTFSKIHDAGLFRQIPVKKGDTVKAQAWAHAWSNAWGTEHTDDPKWSEGAGFSAVAIPWGDTFDDDLVNFTFWVGIDPTGGTHPDAETVIWSDGWHIYNAFDLAGAVEAKAQGDTVTIFLRSTCLWGFKHNDAYWDDVEITVESPVIPDPDPSPEADFGSDVGIHYLVTGQTLNFQEQLLNQGTDFKVFKGVSDWGALKEAKLNDPDLITLARIHSEQEGVGGVNDPDADLAGIAQGLVKLVRDEIQKDPDLADLVDYWEICNEPLGGGSSSDAYERLAHVMIMCMGLAEAEGLKLGIFAFNAGTPEWADMQAIVNTGVFRVARDGGHILTLHEGSFGGPIDQGMGDLIPGAPSVPDGAGSLCFRFRYLYSLLEDRDEVVPLVVSEWYPGPDTPVQDYVWYDIMARPLPYFLAFTPFTCGAAYGWEKQNQEPHYSNGVLSYMIDVKDELNWQVEDPGPDPDPCDHRGLPREQYVRTYVLLPPGAGLTWMNAVTAATWEAQRWTVGNSADDSGIGDLDVRQIVAVNPDAWGEGTDGQGLLGFFQGNYPGVDARQVCAVDPDDLYDQLSGRTFEDLTPLKPWKACGSGPDVPPSYGLFGLHLQTPTAGWEAFHEEAKPSVAVSFWAEAGAKIKDLSPQTLVMWRHWISDAEQDRLLYMDDSHEAARQYLAMFIDAVAQNEGKIDYVPSLNERYTWDNDRVRRAALFDAAFCEELARTGLRVRAGVLAGPVGYPNLSQVDLLRPAVEVAEHYGAVVLYHGYWMMHNGVSLLNERWEQDAGLFLDVLDPVFRSWGHELMYLAGEVGPVGSMDGQTWEHRAGWRSSLCYGGNTAAYMDGLGQLHDRLAIWNAGHGHRYLGGVLFTSYEGDLGWPDFLVKQEQMNAIKARFYA